MYAGQIVERGDRRRALRSAPRTPTPRACSPPSPAWTRRAASGSPRSPARSRTTCRGTTACAFAPRCPLPWRCAVSVRPAARRRRQPRAALPQPGGGEPAERADPRRRQGRQGPLPHQAGRHLRQVVGLVYAVDGVDLQIRTAARRSAWSASPAAASPPLGRGDPQPASRPPARSSSRASTSPRSAARAAPQAPGHADGLPGPHAQPQPAHDRRSRSLREALRSTAWPTRRRRARGVARAARRRSVCRPSR